MKLDLRIGLTVLSGIGMALLATGCAILPKNNMARSTTEYNLVAERAGNEMLLLNIVRASKRRPMYFTTFSKLTGTMTYALETGGINIPFGGSEAPYTIAPKASYSTTPLFDLGVLDTQEFTCGIMTPAPMATIEYYWSQGWPKELLLYLFVRTITVVNPRTGKAEEFCNDPEDPKAFGDFRKQIETRTWRWRIIVDTSSAATKIGDVDPTSASQLKDLIEVQKAGLKLATNQATGKKELHVGQTKYLFVREPRSADKTPADDIMTFATPDRQPPDQVDKFHGTIFLRSPEAMLYYLGEILRVEMQAVTGGTDPDVPIIHDYDREPTKPPAWLFYACRATDGQAAPCASRTRGPDSNSASAAILAGRAPAGAAGPCVSVNYEGTRYVIPGECNPDDPVCTDRSMHVLSLVSQIIGLQKKGLQLPTTGTVTVIGR